MKVKELNKEERPREKALQHGIAALSQSGAAGSGITQWYAFHVRTGAGG
ncbi:MAG: hypothetical protein ACLRS2_16975 [[Clostridium] innocuum]